MKKSVYQTLIGYLPYGRRLAVAAIAGIGACLGLSPIAEAICNQNCSGDDTYYGDSAGTQGGSSTAIGYFALSNNTSSGIQNTAVGSLALESNTVGYNNTAVGNTALQSNTTAIDNTAVGVAAMQLNTTGNHNTAVGLSAMTQNSTGGDNTALGTSASYYNNTGSFNTATGYNALQLNIGGSSNTATGANALFNTSGSSNIAVGDSAGINIAAGSNNIDIGSAGLANDSGRIRIGTKGTHRGANIAGIWGATIPTGIPTIIDANGHLGTTTSSARFKDAIKPMDKTSEAILALKPVTFHYKSDLDPNKVPQFGLVAEEVEKVSPDLVVHDDEGKPYSVRYEAVNAMLLNEFLKEHGKVAELDATVAEQRKEIAALTASVKEQSAQIQKVSAELAVSRSTPRVVSTH